MLLLEVVSMPIYFSSAPTTDVKFCLWDNKISWSIGPAITLWPSFRMSFPSGRETNTFTTTCLSSCLGDCTTTCLLLNFLTIKIRHNHQLVDEQASTKGSLHLSSLKGVSHTNSIRTLRGVNLNYRSRAVAKGLLRTVFCGKLFWSVFEGKKVNCFREVT